MLNPAPQRGQMVLQRREEERAESSAFRRELAEVAFLDQAREETLHRVRGALAIEAATAEEGVQGHQ